MQRERQREIRVEGRGELRKEKKTRGKKAEAGARIRRGDEERSRGGVMRDHRTEGFFSQLM